MNYPRVHKRAKQFWEDTELALWCRTTALKHKMRMAIMAVMEWFLSKVFDLKREGDQR